MFTAEQGSGATSSAEQEGKAFSSVEQDGGETSEAEPSGVAMSSAEQVDAVISEGQMDVPRLAMRQSSFLSGEG